jgi:uncharacterized protein YjiS (DUF1127 family)
MIRLTGLRFLQGITVGARDAQRMPLRYHCASRCTLAAAAPANTDLTANPSSPSVEAVAMFLTLLLSKIRAWLVYRETVRELEQLSDRDLSDLGIGRWRIKETARRGQQADSDVANS